MITYPNGQTEKDTLLSRNVVEENKWQMLPKDEFLYRYLLRNTALRAYDDGLPDEEQKVLKHFGVKYWEPGMEEVLFDEKIYKAIISYN